MAIRWKHWCPKNGCGKRVVHTGTKEPTKRYQCSVCKEYFTTEEIQTKKGD